MSGVKQYSNNNGNNLIISNNTSQSNLNNDVPIIKPKEEIEEMSFDESENNNYQTLFFEDLIESKDKMGINNFLKSISNVLGASIAEVNRRLLKHYAYTDKLNNSGYNAISNSLISDYTVLPTLDTSYVPQGICQVGEYKIITAYDGEKKENSKLYIIDSNGEIYKTLDLGSKSHVGGITYDEKTNSIYISGDSGKDSEGNKNDDCCTIYKINYDDIKNLENNSTIKNIIKIDVDTKADEKHLTSSVGDKSSDNYL